MSSKNKTYVPPGLWEQGPPAYCFGIWGRTGRIWPGERDTAEWIQAEAERQGEGRGEYRAAAVLTRKELRKCSGLYACKCKLGNGTDRESFLILLSFP